MYNVLPILVVINSPSNILTTEVKLLNKSNRQIGLDQNLRDRIKRRIIKPKETGFVWVRIESEHILDCFLHFFADLFYPPFWKVGSQNKKSWIYQNNRDFSA